MQIYVLFTTTKSLHNSVCINIHANKAGLCNHAVITDRQEAAAKGLHHSTSRHPHLQLSAACTNIPAHIALSSPLLQLQAQTKEPGRQLLGHAKTPATMQRCHKLLSCSLKTQSHEAMEGGGNHHQSFQAKLLQP